MNDFESNLTSALRAEADRNTLTVDGVGAAQRLQASLDRIDRDRRRRTWGTVIAFGAAAVLVIGFVLGGGQTHRTIPKPVGPPSGVVPGVEVLARHPFLPNREVPRWWHVTRQAGTRPPRLTHCVGDPRAWGAVQTQAATYIDPNPSAHHNLPGTRVNEFLLQYADTSSAHHALLDAYRELTSCPKPADAVDDPARIERPSGSLGWNFDEGFWRQRSWLKAPKAFYVLRVARAGNVLIVVEDTGITSDRSEYTLSKAVHHALPQYKK